MGQWLTLATSHLVSIAVVTGVLAFALWILSEETRNPFHEYGVRVTLMKCAGLAVAIDIFALIALSIVGAVFAQGAGITFMGLIILGLATSAFWFIGIMLLFEKTLGQAFMLTVAYGFLAWVCVPYALNAVGLSG